MLVVWDSVTATPVRTIFNPHPQGVFRIDISDDARYIVTLSNTTPQEITVWDWSKDAEETAELALVNSEIPASSDSADPLHFSVRFNPTNPNEIATNNSSQVLFWQWNQDEQTFSYDDNDKEMRTFFRHSVEPFTQTVFIPKSTQAVTGTKNGRIIVWDVSFVMDAESNPEQRRPIKIVQLVNAEATVLYTIEDYLVVGSKDGAVRFYDQRFTVEAWFEHIHAGNIMSISFADLVPRRCSEGLEIKEEQFISKFSCPDFIVATDKANIIALNSTLFEQVPPVNISETFSHGTRLVQGFTHPVTAITVHPTKPLIAIAGGKVRQSSYLYVWDYKRRQRIKYESEKGNIIKMQKADPLAVAYSPDGEYLVMSFSDGTLLLLDADNPTKEKQASIKYTDNPKAITNIIFSRDGRAMATMDREKCVTLFKWDHRRGNPDLPFEWCYCGTRNAHYKKINGIAFGESRDESDRPVLRLFSVSEDRRMVEYDTNSSEMTQLEKISTTKIEQEYKPTACIWYPINTGEDILLTMNDAYKIKLWNVNNKGCRLTCLGPTYGGPATKLKLLVKHKKLRSSIDEPDYFVAYATEEKIIGLIKLPADGNPNKCMGLIAHPGQITDLAASGDHKFLFTSGGDDLSVNMWYIDTEAIDKQVAVGGQGEEPFEMMIQGGKYGKTYKDMKDFFYYSQIRSKKENTTKTRKLEGTVPIEEMANLMRAMGYYPSEQEIENMKNEVKYSQFTKTGRSVSSLDLETLLRVFVNHRPVFGIDRKDVQAALNILSDGRGVISREELIDILCRDGEAMQERELRSCLSSLLVPGDESMESYLPEEITADFFVEKILGFEEVAEGEIDGDFEMVEVQEEDA